MAKNDDEEKKDIFMAITTFPEPSKVFDFKPANLSDIKKDCLVVIDTNALLLPYLAKSESLQQIKKTYEILLGEKRLIIPAQVAREFSKNRANKITEIFQFLKQKLSTISGMNVQINEYHLLDELAEYQKMMDLKSLVNKQIQDLCKAIDEVSICIQNWNWNDPVSLIYSELGFSNIVYDFEFDKDEFRSDLERRYSHKIPPGYKDNSKLDEGMGDLLIWKTILKIGKESKKPVIFVTGDEKPDWRHKIGDDVLYPRYELVDEFRRETAGNTFHLARFSEFLNLFDANEEAVTEIAKIEKSFLIITEDELMNLLREHEKQICPEYVGIKRFVTSFLGVKGYEINHSYAIINNLCNKGLMRMYEIETPMGRVTAISSVSSSQQNET